MTFQQYIDTLLADPLCRILLVNSKIKQAVTTHPEKRGYGGLQNHYKLHYQTYEGVMDTLPIPESKVLEMVMAKNSAPRITPRSKKTEPTKTDETEIDTQI